MLEWLVGAHAPALAALPHRGLRLPRASTTTGSARRASTCGRTSSTTSAGWCATAPRPHVCNACPRKDACTDSDHGREIVRPLDPWPHSEAGRFHRGIALVMVGLGLLAARGEGAARNHRPDEAALLLGGALFVSTLVGLYLLAAFRSVPSGFPWAEAERSGPASVPPQPDGSAFPSR